MKLRRISKISNCEIVHYLNNDDIIYSKHNIIYIVFKGKKLKVSMPINIIEWLIGKFRIARRALRLDKCNVFLARNNNLIIIRKSSLFVYSLNTETLKKTLNLKNCKKKIL